MESHRFSYYLRYYGTRFLFMDTISSFLGTSVFWDIIFIDPASLRFTFSFDWSILPIFLFYAMLYGLVYELLSRVASYFGTIDRDVIVHWNGMWCYTTGMIDQISTQEWISPEAIQPHTRLHCQLPKDLLERILCYTQKFEIGRRYLGHFADQTHRMHSEQLIFKAWPARIFGSSWKTADPLWPHCSMMNVVALGSCGTCPQNDRLYFFRVSMVLPDKAQLLSSLKLGDWVKDYTFLFGAMSAYEHNGLTVLHSDNTFVSMTPSFPTYIYDSQHCNILQFDTTILGERDVVLILRKSGVHVDTSEAPLRLIVFSRVGGDHKLYRQEVEHDRKEQRGRIINSACYDMGDYRPTKPFPSGNTVIFPFEKRRNGHSSGKFIIYDTRNGTVNKEKSLADLLLKHESFCNFRNRYRSLGEEEKPLGKELCLLTDNEALVARNSGMLWRIHIQPPTLKYRCLEILLKHCDDEELEEFSKKKWLKFTGMDLPGHFD